MNLGVVALDLMGHLNPAIELARELEALGHRAVMIVRTDGAKRCQQLGMRFQRYDVADVDGKRALGRHSGLRALSALADYLDTANDALLVGLWADGFDALVIDETLQAACLVSAFKRIPYATYCAALAMAYDPAIPPPVFGWQPARGALGRLRDRLGWAAFAWLMRKPRRRLEAYRRLCGIPFYDSEGRSVYAGLAQVAQQPAWLDFPREWGQPFLATGAWVTRDQEEAPFPWWWLDGRPLHYVCMGTVARSGKAADAIVDAVLEAARCDAQVVVSLGGAEPATHLRDQLAELYGSATDAPRAAWEMVGSLGVLAVQWAPHYELIKRADLVVTNAGLNTTLACLEAGTPMAERPLAFDQPGIAARLAWAGRNPS